MRIEKTLRIDEKEVYFESLPLKELKKHLFGYEEIVIENKLETFGSIVRFTHKQKTFDDTFIEEYVICEIGEEENDDEKLAKALRIIYEKMAEDIVNNILLNN